MIKVLVLFSSSDIGGAEKSLSRIFNSNSDSGIKYTLATFGNEGDFSEWMNSKKRKLLCFNYILIDLIKFVYKTKPSVIYVIGFRLSILLRFLKIILPKYKIIQGVRWNPNSNCALDKVFRVFESFFSFLLDSYIVNSKSAKKTLAGIGINKTNLIYNGIKVKKRNKEQSRGKSVITIANLSERKGYKEYLIVIKRIIHQMPEIKFIFIGKDMMNGEIQKLITQHKLNKHIQYLGYQSDVNKFLIKSSIFVLPSKYGEGCPTTILEAFSHSLPVLAFNIDGISELVKNGTDGYLFSPGDYGSLEKKIIDLYSNDEELLKMGTAGYKKVLSCFSMKKALELHNNFFRDIVK